MLSLGEIQAIDHLRIVNMKGNEEGIAKRIVTDSRIVKPGDLFIALRGERFDGSAFVKDAFRNGACCAIVEKPVKTNRPYILVRDSVQALGDVARLHRRKFSIPVIAVTGSSGKTTTKEMILAVLGTTYRVLATKGNLNNHIGVPQTLLGLTARHDLAVIEMGMNHSGELTYLCRVAEPTHGLITNVGKAHLEYFRTIKKIAEAKGELFAWIGKSRRGKGFVNLDDAYVVRESRRLKDLISYSAKSASADVKAELVQVDRNGYPLMKIHACVWKKPVTVRLKIAGIQNVSNALAAAAVGIEFGVFPQLIKKGLESFTPVRGRMEVLNKHGITIINDAYNANPESVRSALETIARMQCRGRRILVLGDMLELGTAALREHRTLGAEITSRNCDLLLGHGPLTLGVCKHSTAHEKYHFESKEELIATLTRIVKKHDIVLVKGSHGMHMDEIVTALTSMQPNREQRKTGGGKH